MIRGEACALVASADVAASEADDPEEQQPGGDGRQRNRRWPREGFDRHPRHVGERREVHQPRR